MSNNIVPIGEATKTQRPSNSAFKQQKLSAWQPILTAGTVLPTFFLIGVAFIPVGIGLLISSYQVQEYEVDYTSCKRFDYTENSSLPALCSEYVENNWNSNCTCRINFNLTRDFNRDVFLYYGLVNFYQNHRRYVRSRGDAQLLSRDLDNTRNCAPFTKRIDPIDDLMKSIVPCGAVANSLFNDTFSLERLTQENDGFHWRTVPFVYTGIAWATDKKNKFRNPPIAKGQTLAQAFNGTVKPVNWPRPIYELDKDPLDNGLQNEGLIVWMRTAAFPTFRKIYARLAHDRRDSVDYSYLPMGEYRLTVHYNYPVAAFKGKKRFIISNTSWLGGKNPFIGAVYVLVGILSIILAGIFLIIHKKYNKNSADNLMITSQTPFVVS